MKVELADQFDVTTSPADTFAFLTDPERFALLLPYFKELKDVQPGAFTVGLEIGIPQVRGRVDVDVKLVECVAPERATYRSSGRHALGMVDSELGFSVAPSGTGSSVSPHPPCSLGMATDRHGGRVSGGASISSCTVPHSSIPNRTATAQSHLRHRPRSP